MMVCTAIAHHFGSGHKLVPLGAATGAVVFASRHASPNQNELTAYPVPDANTPSSHKAAPACTAVSKQ